MIGWFCDGCGAWDSIFFWEPAAGSGLAELLKHPLVLLLVGAALSGWLIPHLLRRIEQRRATVKLKADLVERISRAVSDALVIVDAAAPPDPDQSAGFRRWQQEKAVLGAVLAAHFRGSAVADAWRRVRAVTTAHFRQLEIGGDRRARYLSHVARGLSANKPMDWSEEEPSPDAEEVVVDTIDLVDPRLRREAIRGYLKQTVTAVIDASSRS